MRTHNALSNDGNGLQIERERDVLTFRVVDALGCPISQWADINESDLGGYVLVDETTCQPLADGNAISMWRIKCGADWWTTSANALPLRTTSENGWETDPMLARGYRTKEAAEGDRDEIAASLEDQVDSPIRLIEPWDTGEVFCPRCLDGPGGSGCGKAIHIALDEIYSLVLGLRQLSTGSAPYDTIGRAIERLEYDIRLAQQEGEDAVE